MKLEEKISGEVLSFPMFDEHQFFKHMNNRLILLFCLALLFSTSHTFAQLSKTEKKEWKKKAKEFSKNPANLKQLTEDKAAAESQVASLNQKLTQLQSSVSDKDARVAELEDQLSQTRTQLTTTRAELAQLKETPVVNPMDFSKGVVFKVQIGAFKNKDLQKYFENNPNFGGEVKEGEPQKITIGIFRDYWEADIFKKYMREMGVKDAWIVPYRDGTRVEIKDVLEGVVGDKPAPTEEGTN
jgi:outer membrane murein-binding lipoprotein Lpp